MKKNNIFAFLGAVFLLSSLFISCGNKAFKDDFGCLLDFEEGKSLAKKSGKDILLFVTLDGEDYLSSDFITNVMHTEDFSEQVAKNFQVVHIDLSSANYQKGVAEPNASKAEVKKAESYSKQLSSGRMYASILNCQSAPSIYRFTKEGMLVSELEYDTPQNSVEQLVELIASYDEAKNELAEKLKEIETGSVTEKIAKIDALYSASNEKQRGFFSDLAKKIIEMDKKNESGLVGKYLTVDADLKAVKYCGIMDFDSAAKAYASITENQYLEKKDKMNAYFMAAYILGMSRDASKVPQILAWLDKAKETDPESPGIETINSMYAYFEAMLNDYEASKSIE